MKLRENPTEPEGIRTPDPRLRRPLLYPAELQTHQAGDGNRTHVSSLEGWCSTIELHPHILLRTVEGLWKTIGVTGFEPATSWSQTRRSSQAEPHPASNYSTYPQNHTLKIYPSVFTTYNHGVTHRLSAYFVTLASPMSESCQVPACRCKHLPSVPFHSSAAP